MAKVKYISVYHYCRKGAGYHIRFNRGKGAAETPRYIATPSSLRRLEKLFYNLESLMPAFRSNYVHLQAFVKGEWR